MRPLTSASTSASKRPRRGPSQRSRSPAAASQAERADRRSAGRPRPPGCRTRRPGSSSRSRPRAPGSRGRSARERTAPAVVGGQLDRDVLEIRRALGAQVDDDVEDRATRAAHQLGLGGRRILKVHPAERPLRRLNAMFACAMTGFSPCASNSRWQNVRAKKPRSSSRARGR